MTDGDRSDGAERPNDRTDDGAKNPADHLDDVADGCGCAEVWEYLSERRTAEE